MRRATDTRLQLQQVGAELIAGSTEHPAVIWGLCLFPGAVLNQIEELR